MKQNDRCPYNVKWYGHGPHQWEIKSVQNIVGHRMVHSDNAPCLLADVEVEVQCKFCGEKRHLAVCTNALTLELPEITRRSLLEYIKANPGNEVARLREAFIKAIERPMGVIPAGYEDIYQDALKECVQR